MQELAMLSNERALQSHSSNRIHGSSAPGAPCIGRGGGVTMDRWGQPIEYDPPCLYEGAATQNDP